MDFSALLVRNTTDVDIRTPIEKGKVGSNPAYSAMQK